MRYDFDNVLQYTHVWGRWYCMGSSIETLHGPTRMFQDRWYSVRLSSGCNFTSAARDRNTGCNIVHNHIAQ